MNKTLIRAITIADICGDLTTHERKLLINGLTKSNHKGIHIVPGANKLVNSSMYGQRHGIN